MESMTSSVATLAVGESTATTSTTNTTTIVKIENSDGDDQHAHQEEDESWFEDVKGLVYLDDHDGFIDPDAVKIELPKCTIDDTVTSVYQCIKCGNKQPAENNIHRMKCSRCYNKAFNKVRPTKWVKFNAI